MNKNIWGHELDAVSIDFLRECEPAEGYVLAFSGGKDSVVIHDLAERAGVQFKPIYSITNVDPPELVWFIKRRYPHVERRTPAKSMWRLIEDKGLPTIRYRFCCEQLKERVTRNATIITGVRADESVARRSRGPFEQSRKYADVRFVHPILSWTSADVWCYIRERGLPYCELYDQGFSRLGCVVCPFNRDIRASMRRWPKLFAAARRAVQRRWDTGKAAELTKPKRFDGPEDFWQWWLRRVESGEPYPEPQRQCGGLFV